MARMRRPPTSPRPCSRHSPSPLRLPSKGGGGEPDSRTEDLEEVFHLGVPAPLGHCGDAELTVGEEPTGELEPDADDLLLGGPSEEPARPPLEGAAGEAGRPQVILQAQARTGLGRRFTVIARPLARRATRPSATPRPDRSRRGAARLR